MGRAVDCERVGADLAACIGHMVAQRRSEIRKTVGGQQGVVDVNLLVLFNWATTWRVSDLIPAEFARPILDAMHQPMLRALTDAGLSEADAEGFVHERYAEYYDAIKTREGGAAIQHIAACFVGFCDPDPQKRGVYYSLDLMKIMPVAIELGGFGKAIQEALVEIIKQRS